ncbi:MAG: chorismate-binding protein [Bacteroidia bacterium]|nr:chorismate-binding protein [Bacteroidia bacterium]
MDYQQIVDRIDGLTAPFAVMREPDTDVVLWFEGDSYSNFIMHPYSEEAVGRRPLEATSQTDYQQSFQEVKNYLNEGVVDKVVLSRVVSHEGINSHSLGTLFAHACQLYPHQMIYLWVNGNNVWLGCTPELLLSYNANTSEGQTMALAGTRPAVGSDVKWDSKNIREQAVVSSWIVSQLKNEGIDVRMGEVYTTQAGGLEHLRTDISMQIPDAVVAEKVLNILHPTPAVCGQPRAKAMDIISRVEKHDREFYSGFVGYHNDNGMRIYVNLRCAALDIMANRAFIFVGGGIMPDSVCETEFQETEYKAQTIKRVLKCS